MFLLPICQTNAEDYFIAWTSQITSYLMDNNDYLMKVDFVSVAHRVCVVMKMVFDIQVAFHEMKDKLLVLFLGVCEMSYQVDDNFEQEVMVIVFFYEPNDYLEVQS
uniref:CSON013006 protein n=1 Tax=Culicoides sonorensis TaxID=179676 RepID=A0A336LMU1_CULSO